MSKIHMVPFPAGIIPVVQTPFHPDGQIDFLSLERLVQTTIEAGVAGLLAPVVASEVTSLGFNERIQILECIASVTRQRVPLVVGASSDDPDACRKMAEHALRLKAVGWLVAVPQSGYRDPKQVIPFFQTATRDVALPLMIQDLEFGGPGMALPLIESLRLAIPMFSGIKIETVPSGPKYSAVRRAFGSDFYIAGGWAIPQMIEALDRGIDGMIPESSMVKVYCEINRLYTSGQRVEAIRLFRQLLPILSFTNQELVLSIAFFKRLLVRKGIFGSETLRLSGFQWDSYNQKIADELIDLYLQIESTVS